VLCVVCWRLAGSTRRCRRTLPSHRTSCTRYVTTRTSPLRFSLPNLMEIRPRSLSPLRSEWLLQENFAFLAVLVSGPYLLVSSGPRAWFLRLTGEQQGHSQLLKLASVSVTIYFLCFGIRFSTNRKTIKLGWKPANERQRAGGTNKSKRNEVEAFISAKYWKSYALFWGIIRIEARFTHKDDLCSKLLAWGFFGL